MRCFGEVLLFIQKKTKGGDIKIYKKTTPEGKIFGEHGKYTYLNGRSKTKGKVMKMYKILPLTILAMMVSFTLAGSVSAETQNAVEQICTLGLSADKWARAMAYSLFVIGLILIAISAFFGKFKSINFISLGGGLFVVSTSNLLIAYLTNGGVGSLDCP